MIHATLRRELDSAKPTRRNSARDTPEFLKITKHGMGSSFPVTHVADVNANKFCQFFPDS
jgi:hypothetical protein